MRKIKFLLALLPLLMFSIQSHGYAINDTFVVDGITYRVMNNNYEVRVVGIAKSGDIVIEPTVFDGIDQTFKVTSIGSWSNGWDTGITSLTLPEGMVRIGESNAFNGCSSLKVINLPASLTSIDSGAFSALPSLKEIKVSDDNSNFCSVDGVLYTKDMTELVSYPQAKEVGTNNDGIYTVDERVKKIWGNAFYGNNNLKEITIPSSVVEFGIGFYNPFCFCYRLTSINVTEGNTLFSSIDGVLFDKDKKTLIIYPCGKNVNGSYEVPDGVETIQQYAFHYGRIKSIGLDEVVNLEEKSIAECNYLENITIPAGLVNIPEGAIMGCTGLKNYYVNGENPNYKDIDGVLCSKDGTLLLAYPAGRNAPEYDTYVIPESVTEIGPRSFFRSGIKNVVITENVQTMSQEVFRLSNIEEVSIDGKSSLETIEGSAFSQCSFLKKITIPASVKIISGSAFTRCVKLEEVIIENGSLLKTIGTTAFYGCKILPHLTFQGSCTLTNVQGRAFEGCESLEEFTFPKTVTSIGTSAFSGCKSMTKATFADDAAITTIGRNAFDDCGLVEINIPASVKSIAAEAFKNCDLLKSVSIPAATTYVDPEAFKFCTSLKNLEVSPDNTVYSSVDGMLLSKDKETLMIFPSGKANDKFTLLPPSITKIGDYAFYDCLNLKNVTIPNKVTAIGKRAFGLCSNLNTIAFLCDEMIKPANIDQELNTKSFDDDMYQKININVRKDKLQEYQNEAFYKQFLSTTPSFMSENGNEEYIIVSDNAVDLLSTKNTDHTYVLPTEVSFEGSTYSVGLIGDYAFQNVAASMKEVVVPESVGYIGAKAFMTDIENNTSTIESIFFLDVHPGTETLSTLRFNLDDTGNNYNEFADRQKIYVKKSVVDTYRAAWKKHSKAIDYRIPGISISTKYGTFAREFDTYIGDYEGVRVLAFVGGEYREGSGDYGPETEYCVRMQSIVAVGYDGLYVPKNTGVLLKVMDDKDATPDDFYYCIGENDDDDKEHDVAENMMKGVTVNSEQVSGYDKWVMQGGQFRCLEGQTATIPVHKAYLHIEGANENSKLVLQFDDGSTTEIVNVEKEDDNSDAVYYNLGGMRVTRPQNGVYIRNGKKVVVK